MKLELLPMTFSVCRIADGSAADLTAPFTFFARTDQEVSLVCESARAPRDALATEHGWRCLRVSGPLDFSLIGILAGIAQCLADAGVSIFAVSTFDTDYILVKNESLSAAVATLRDRDYEIAEA